jgi:hypothetical protein
MDRPKQQKIVFYSWQSDLSNGTNRTLIENALKEAAIEITNDESIDVEPVIDRDTQGSAGAVDIASTIFGKIDVADIFVADISIVINSRKRSTPNPNVLIELGYALKALSHERLVLVFNEASGKKEKLPFDLKTRKILIYNCPDSLTDRSEVKKGLVRDLKSALVTGFKHVSASNKQTPTSSIIDIIKSNAPSKKIELRSYLAEVLKVLDKLQPAMYRDGGTVEDLLEALPKTEAHIAIFAKLAETLVLMNDFELSKDIFKWFGDILTRYNPRPDQNGRTSRADGDFFKVVGHELFVVFITPFLKEEKFKELQELLKGTLRVGATSHKLHETTESWDELSNFSPLLADEARKKGRTSLHADILKGWHETGPVAQIISLKDFTSTDFFLYLYGEGKTSDEYRSNWYPQSVVWLEHTPSYILEAVTYPKAMMLCRTLAIGDIEELKKRLMSGRRLGDIGYFALPERDIQAIGSTGGGKVIVLNNE